MRWVSEDSERLKVVNYFRKKDQLQSFDWIVNTPLNFVLDLPNSNIKDTWVTLTDKLIFNLKQTEIKVQHIYLFLLCKTLCIFLLEFQEAAVQRCSVKKVFL